MNILAAFNVLSPRALEREEDDCIENLKLLARKFLPVDEGALLKELASFKVRLAQGIFKAH